MNSQLDLLCAPKTTILLTQFLPKKPLAGLDKDKRNTEKPPMKNRATFEITEHPTHIQLRIAGIVDEYSAFPDFVSSLYRDIIVDLIDFQSINSMGIREWIPWINHQQFNSMTFKRCPKVFIDQLNNVEGFIPEKARIASFFVPYFSETSDEEAAILFSRGEHFSNGKIIQLPHVLDSNLIRMEADIILDKYLRFLPRFGL